MGLGFFPLVLLLLLLSCSASALSFPGSNDRAAEPPVGMRDELRVLESARRNGLQLDFKPLFSTLIKPSAPDGVSTCSVCVLFLGVLNQRGKTCINRQSDIDADN